MRIRAGGLLIENGKILLIHRIKDINGETKEYYVIPGGGVEEGETLAIATIRELKEETGLDVELLSNEPLLSLSREKETHYYILVKKTNGEIGTGKGPEFTDPSYANKGFYGIEMINIKDIINGKINLVPEEIKKQFISILSNHNIDNLSSINLIK